MADLLLVEDDLAVAEALQLALHSLGHHVLTAGDGESGLAMLSDPASSIQLAIVDVMLPGIDGFELCRRISTSDGVPIVLLTARSDPIDIVVGLECGADDYVTKPVEPRVLDARIKAVLRRAVPAGPARSTVPIALGSALLDRAAMQVTRDGHQVSLTPTELRLLIELVDHRGHVLTRRALLERVWEYGYAGDTRLVDSAVQRLRSKVEDDPANPALITTVRGVGYRMERP